MKDVDERMKIKVETDLERYYRYELMNHIGYMLATVAAFVGLFRMDLFLQFVSLYRMVTPVVSVIFISLIIYFATRILDISRYMNVALGYLVGSED